MTAEKADRDAKETVIDKLINWQSLTDSEKTTLEKIKTERAKRKAEMTKIKTILEKKKAWTALTADDIIFCLLKKIYFQMKVNLFYISLWWFTNLTSLKQGFIYPLKYLLFSKISSSNLFFL